MWEYKGEINPTIKETWADNDGFTQTIPTLTFLFLWVGLDVWESFSFPQSYLIHMRLCWILLTLSLPLYYSVFLISI